MTPEPTHPPSTPPVEPEPTSGPTTLPEPTEIPTTAPEPSQGPSTPPGATQGAPAEAHLEPVAAEVTASRPPSPSYDDELAQTGSEVSLTALGVAGGLVAVGTGVLVYARRRTTT